VKQITLWQITTPRFCAGFEAKDGRMVRTAPILSWLRGQTVSAARTWAQGHGGTCFWIG
jgi:hypothetical protein